MENESANVVTLNLGTLFLQGDVRYSTNRDVAMVRFEDCNPTNSELVTYFRDIVTFNVDSLTPTPIKFTWAKKFDDIVVGSDIFLIGFPASIGLNESPQIDPSVPLLRRGVLAGKNKAARNLVLDCPSFQGNSGGPVIEREQLLPDGVLIHVVGIMLEFVPYRQTWQNQQFGFVNQEWSNSGYSIAEPIDTVLEMVWK